MGATPNDYFRAEEGRIYDFGPGLGTRIVASIDSGIWNYLKLLYYNALIWTQSEPSDSRHFIQILLLTARYPLTSFFSVGVSAGLYFRGSYYDNFPDVNKNHPIIRVFFETALINK